ncbi:MAG: hypothetical protein M3511_00785 [Deinococcota bacterium]|jgi:hypothetical protein|nr:hypothetical protein [Deinococcota bacterium]
MSYKLKIQRSYQMVESNHATLEEAIQAAASQTYDDVDSVDGTSQAVFIEDEEGNPALEESELQRRIAELRGS